MFDKFITLTLENEGGYTYDTGGETKFGISKRSYPNVDIENLTKEDAINIYKRDYYNPLYDHISDSNVSFKLFDIGVNIGKTNAVKRLQWTLNDYYGEELIADGIFGKKTLGSVNKHKYLYPLLLLEYSLYYKAISKSTNNKYLAGWLKRLYKHYKEI